MFLFKDVPHVILIDHAERLQPTLRKQNYFTSYETLLIATSSQQKKCTLYQVPQAMGSVAPL